MSSVVGVASAFIAINWFLLESIWAKAKTRGGCKVYPPPMGLRVLFVATIPTMLYGTVASYLQNPRELWVSAILLGTAIFSAYFYPSTIPVCSKGVVSIKWFGLKRVSMPWDQVEAIYAVPEERSIVVQDKEQKQITHTMFNIDRGGFLEEVSS